MDMTVSAGERRPCFSVSVVNDNIYKTNKMFKYSLGSHDPRVTIQGAPRGVIEILDNDEQAVIIGFEYSEYTIMEGESIEACMWMTGAPVGQPFSFTFLTGQTSSINQCELHGSF